jgi:hypothetical protein
MLEDEEKSGGSSQDEGQIEHGDQARRASTQSFMFGDPTQADDNYFNPWNEGGGGLRTRDSELD